MMITNNLTYTFPYSMKRILREIIETFEWNLVFMLREKLLNFILPFYLFKNSLILIFIVFPLIQTWKMSRNFFFFYRLSISLRECERGNTSSFEEEKNSTQFLPLWVFCSLFMGQRFTIIATESVSVSLTTLPPPEQLMKLAEMAVERQFKNNESSL